LENLLIYSINILVSLSQSTFIFLFFKKILGIKFNFKNKKDLFHLLIFAIGYTIFEILFAEYGISTILIVLFTVPLSSFYLWFTSDKKTFSLYAAFTAAMITSTIMFTCLYFIGFFGDVVEEIFEIEYSFNVDVLISLILYIVFCLFFYRTEPLKSGFAFLMKGKRGSFLPLILSSIFSVAAYTLIVSTYYIDYDVFNLVGILLILLVINIYSIYLIRAFSGATDKNVKEARETARDLLNTAARKPGNDGPKYLAFFMPGFIKEDILINPDANGILEFDSFYKFVAEHAHEMPGVSEDREVTSELVRLSIGYMIDNIWKNTDLDHEKIFPGLCVNTKKGKPDPKDFLDWFYRYLKEKHFTPHP